MFCILCQGEEEDSATLGGGRAGWKGTPIKLGSNLWGGARRIGWDRGHVSKNRKRCRQTGSQQSTPYRRSGSEMEIQYRPRKLHTDLQNPAEFSPKGKPVQNFSIDPASSIRTRLRTPFLRTPFSETSNVHHAGGLPC